MRRFRRHTTRAEWLDPGFLFAMIGTVAAHTSSDPTS
jgi:hypothetical protein